MKTLLLVEDEKLIRQGVRSMIERSGVEIENIIECNNGEAALEILKNQEVDVMFTDIRMPKMDGITLVSKASEFKKKPLIAAVSGFDDFDYAVGMLRNGVQEYILKPVDRKKITETLVKFEGIYEAEQEKYMQERNVAFQQLKYMIFCDDITVAKLENTCHIIHKYIPFDKYAVFCFSAKEDDNEFTEKDKYFYVQGRDSLNFIITDAQYFNDVKAKLQHYYVGVSLVYENFFDVKQAFCEAAQMRRFSFEKCEKLVDADGFKELPKDFEYGVKYMMQTANLICSNKLEEAISQLTAFSEGVKSGKYNINEFQEQMKIIIRTTMKVYKNVLANNEEDINELADIYAFETIDVYMDVIKEWINHFNELVGQDIDEHKTNIKMQKAIEYIKEKYATDLNMAVVSNYISMNYSLFSYTFKQYTGTNFVNYLKNIRVGEAKKLLTETDMKINEISQAVGYDHEKHFMKTFKSITGLTPSQYRNNLG